MTPGSPGIDFVEDEEPDAPDEELPSPATRAWRRRVEAFVGHRYGVPVVVVVLVLAYLGGRAILHQRPLSVPGRTASSSDRVVLLDPSNGRAIVGLPRRSGSDPTRCPGLQCFTSSSVPSSVRAAVRAVFPAARFTAVETVRIVNRAQGNPLWYREVDARIGTATLTLQVQAPSTAGDISDGGAKDDGAHSTSYVDAAVELWFVRARVSDRSGTGDVFDKLTRLTADRRLLAP